MVTVKVDKKTKKCTIIDEAEGTPGASRQITRFREKCLPILESQVKLPVLNRKDIEFNEFEFKFMRMDEDSKMITISWETIA